MPPRAAAAAAAIAAAAMGAAEAAYEHEQDGPQRGRGAQNARAQAAERNMMTPLSDDEVVATEAFKILGQFKTPKDIRISVRGEYWERLPSLHGTRLEGTILQWVRKEPPDRRLRVLWPDGHDTELLDQLFHPDVDLTFLPYADGRPAPRLTGRAAAREARERAESERANAEEVVIDYIDGGTPKQQVWKVERPDGITIDQRTEDWKKPSLNRSLNTLNSPYRMWSRAALPLGLLTKMQKYFNQRLDGETKEYDRRQTTIGELLQFFSYMGALAVERR